MGDATALREKQTAAYAAEKADSRKLWLRLKRERNGGFLVCKHSRDDCTLYVEAPLLPSCHCHCSKLKQKNPPEEEMQEEMKQADSAADQHGHTHQVCSLKFQALVGFRMSVRVTLCSGNFNFLLKMNGMWVE